MYERYKGTELICPLFFFLYASYLSHIVQLTYWLLLTSHKKSSERE